MRWCAVVKRCRLTLSLTASEGATTSASRQGATTSASRRSVSCTVVPHRRPSPSSLAVVPRRRPKSEMDAYNEFVTAAVNCHVEYGCNITPKVHLMYKHVRQQMELPGGLGQKREDWVEHQHQISKRARENYKTTINKKQRSISMTAAIYRDTDPEVKKEREETIAATARGPRSNYIHRAEVRREQRLEARETALDQWTSRFD